MTLVSSSLSVSVSTRVFSRVCASIVEVLGGVMSSLDMTASRCSSVVGWNALRQKSTDFLSSSCVSLLLTSAVPWITMMEY